MFTSETMTEHAKGIVVTAVWFAGFIGVLIPVRWSGSRKNEAMMSVMTCFAAGVILSVAMCHLLPDSIETFSKTTDYPLANFLAALGLLTVLLVEKAFTDPHQAVIGHLGHSHSPQRQHAEHGYGGMDHRSTASHHSHSQCHDAESLPEGDHLAHDVDGCSIGNRHHHHVQYQSKLFRKGMDAGVSLTKHMVSDKEKGCNRDDHTADHGIDVKFEEKPIGSWVSLTVLAVLSFHSVVEGIALGSAVHPHEVLLLAVAILAHKFLAALSLGISFLKSSTPQRKHVTYGLLFSIATPFGALVGAALSDLMASDDVAYFSAVCQSIGSGTFLYISLMEFIPEEMHGDGIVKKWIAAFFGFLLMALVALYV
eukprot:TRINITY_DN13190_c1_g1_i1.p1 TRINITY_DN13190_c1_g1~~TRINITY_DN13190_c1_g1_i1.p1  ORF type:complete len:367 (+),score=137.16 TRINITY_DN13190_c1_g1_i1:48-1148(+)